jgi:hypothetical protein
MVWDNDLKDECFSCPYPGSIRAIPLLSVLQTGLILKMDSALKIFSNQFSI